MAAKGIHINPTSKSYFRAPKMAATNPHLFSTAHLLISRGEKEKFLNQRAKVVWLTGLSGSGKTTLAKHAERELLSKGIFTKLLDGDNVRLGINQGLGFGEADRIENIRRIAEVARLFLDGGVVCICCFVSPTHQLRQLARTIVGPDDFIEVFVNTPLEECERRDVKGLYAKARTGEVKDFTGISAPFEDPENPQITIYTQGKTKEVSGRELVEALLPLLKL